MLFRTPQTIYRKQPGHYDHGEWVEGTLVAGTIEASVQPASQGDYDRMRAALEGRRIESMIRLYSDDPLEPAGFDGTNMTNGDEVDYAGYRYLVVALSPWQSGVISHYRILAARFPQ